MSAKLEVHEAQRIHDLLGRYRKRLEKNVEESKSLPDELAELAAAAAREEIAEVDRAMASVTVGPNY